MTTSNLQDYDVFYSIHLYTASNYLSNSIVGIERVEAEQTASWNVRCTWQVPFVNGQSFTFNASIRTYIPYRKLHTLPKLNALSSWRFTAKYPWFEKKKIKLKSYWLRQALTANMSNLKFVVNQWQKGNAFTNVTNAIYKFALYILINISDKDVKSKNCLYIRSYITFRIRCCVHFYKNCSCIFVELLIESCLAPIEDVNGTDRKLKCSMYLTGVRAFAYTLGPSLLRRINLHVYI